ncbi:MAG: D-tyrosyl-tRNA(Tyr) deacylase [Candidatus Edwardsbacteria bacterium RIFOXYD12_FULL_50_11]|jgi:D-tyrosyl-tRNA(Tyr) deacylase|uniref:D-aminoacyl-tRNA deacylase n=1 Tax=Candidatus Edwardsbacteria bacterium GWF2_54_11 TaxID=1817851 RepID=A0A1F5RI90_9BACT|nr:MAG: D-tyrosyl-tRNA(Tyr) deacylase [Candidatus Edwardsbacteria bacterium RifOxyC12_full_54_24]OGF06996.1 MAG: D-tyrosyl-tRNA(Tyr) deacylase [Candidatus Edwardsbacteria bacterium RifOxyA12_full_54_48]OGF11038.1 MAG: D-tyrosyl-tRNA(Tyr) deacylase [Candidatus Edwardsbacteria bacterium GWE2_54_12]OGF14062.1 MAG: D-tyrosyl-tRNA(Tyr) deacylase [Candidatus Edwardsbacteria bacterium GWF2_54_11]OGF15984.1 MAG: D-tyrosyl-tRNA(Tyr) deacylase [Candidatus Edwardsbacteria bacterium RIFOXYD12_FULL_50_11]O
MRLVIQRVSSASVTVENDLTGKIGQGLVILAGFSHLDDEAVIGKLAEKAVNLRIFEDAEGKMNLSLLDVRGGILLVSQFTLYADCRKGRRPSFTDAAAPEKAQALYQKLITAIKSYGIEVQTGMFGAKMLVEINNDGPVTVILDSRDIC